MEQKTETRQCIENVMGDQQSRCHKSRWITRGYNALFSWEIYSYSHETGLFKASFTSDHFHIKAVSRKESLFFYMIDILTITNLLKYETLNIFVNITGFILWTV